MGDERSGRARAISQAKRLLTTLPRLTLPVPVDQLARATGAVLTYQAFDGDISGVVIRKTEMSIIGVNSAHPATRQRFTVAHELGHLKLHEGEPLIIDKLVRVNLRRGTPSVPTDAVEREANWFAAALLMPDDLVMREVRRLVPKPGPVSADDLVARLAVTFAVSPQAMSFRLRELDVLTAFEHF